MTSINDKSKKVLVLATILAAGASFSASVGEARAQTQIAFAATPVCDLSEAVAHLSSIRGNNSLSYLDKQRQEAEARRQLLLGAINCDQEEITALTQALEGLPENAKGMRAYKLSVEGLAKASVFYSEYKNKASNESMALQETKTISGEIADWREANYEKTVALIDNLILWAGNQEFLNRASNRINQVNRLVFSLKLVNLEDGTASKVEKARESLGKALSENSKAQEDLNEGQANKALEHIQISLKDLRETYRVFLDLQGELKSVVK